jgi:hypothetical protein
MEKAIKILKKSQLSVDFIIVLSIAFIIFLVMFSIADKRNNTIDSQRTRLYAKQEADKLALELNSMQISGPSVNKTIRFPDSLKDETPYNMTIYPQERLVRILYDFQEKTRHYDTTILTSNVSNTSDIKGNIKLVHSEGGIEIEKQ